LTWLAASMLILGGALLAGFAWYERRHPTSRVLALVATLAALAALGRIAFAPLPNVKPTTDIVLISGYVLGGAPGFAVGAVAALTSNLFFGQGPWTPWQMVAWGAVGVGGAALAHAGGRRLGRVPLAAACGLAGAFYGAVMNVSLWVTYSGSHSWPALAAYFGTSLWFDVAHVIGNVLFCLAFGPLLVRALARYRTRFEVTWVPAAAAVAVLAVIVAFPPPAGASVRSSAGYLLRAQNRDGGWGAAPDQGSDPLYSGWAALGLAAAGRHPGSAVRYVRNHLGGDVGSLERGILVLAADGARTRGPVARLIRARRRSGSFDGTVNHTAFAVLALRAAGRSRHDRAVRSAAGWIAGQHNRDGGFNFAGRGGPSGIDDTAAAIQALVSAGRRSTGTVRRAARFLVRHQNLDGGFPLQPGAGSNAQSTAWAVQALIAARHGGVRRALGYLRSLTTGSGAVRYSRTSAQTPVWVTAEALMALARKPLPL
jgi:energy-coupling factor transport system substrate-specific component